MMKKYVLVGASGRALGMYATPMVREYGDVAKIVGIFDVNRVRSEYIKNTLGLDCPVYTDYEAMMAETKPDTAIVTTVDRFHHEYTIRTLEHGCDVICEKPMTMDEEKCQAVLDAEKRTGKKVTVTFNYRFTPYVTRIKELLDSGVIGRVLNVDFEWILDRSHGADYFRRWHRKLENCGGLLVHKSTHHFDIINWWLGDDPAEVYANGALHFYGPKREERGERCLTCNYTKTCEFVFKEYDNPQVQGMYFKAEKEDGYFRDRCVFADEINIYDTMSVAVKYAKGALLSYSLVAYSPYEGWRASFTGTDGRIEVSEFHSGQEKGNPNYEIKLFNTKNEIITYAVPKAQGGHGGGDAKLQRMLFRGDLPDPLHHFAGTRDGAMSILIGIAANKSIKEKRAVDIRDLVDID